MSKNSYEKVNVPFDAGSMSPKTSPLITHVPPRVFFLPTAWREMNYIIDYCPVEIGWLGLVEQPNKNDLLITDIFVPEQEVTGATTEIDEQAHAKLVLDLDSQGRDVNKLLYWGHSHVNMGVSPSRTDEEQLAHYIEQLETSDFFIRGIHNKKGDAKVDVFDVKNNLLFQKVSIGLWAAELSETRKEELRKTVDTNASRPAARVNVYPTGYKGFSKTYMHHHQQQLTAQSNVVKKTEESPEEEETEVITQEGYSYHPYIYTSKDFSLEDIAAMAESLGVSIADVHSAISINPMDVEEALIEAFNIDADEAWDAMKIAY